MKRKDKTIDEIVDYVLVRGGPDLDRRAHPKKKRVFYRDLGDALRIVHSQDLLPDLRAYHFKDVINIWNEGGFSNKKLGREMTNELMQRLIQKHGNLAKAIENISKEPFESEELKFKTYDGVIVYNLAGMFCTLKFDDKHVNSPYVTVKHWIDNNDDKRIRTEYKDLKPWHLANASRDCWQGEEGKKNGRELTDELMQKLIQKHGNLAKVIENISTDSFRKEQLEFKTSDGIIKYTLCGMFQNVKFDDKHISSSYVTVKYWIDTHPNERIKREYAGLKPWHLFQASQETWQGEEGKKNGREATDELMQRLIQRHRSLAKAIENISTLSFKEEQLEFKTSDGIIRYNLSGMFQNVKFDDKHVNSPYHILKHWIDNNDDKRIRTEYKDLKSWHLANASRDCWQGEEGKKNGRKATDELMQKLIQKHGNLAKALEKISSKHFKEEQLEFKTFDGVITYNLNGMFAYVKFDDKHSSSPYPALKYWIDTHNDKTLKKKYARELDILKNRTKKYRK